MALRIAYGGDPSYSQRYYRAHFGWRHEYDAIAEWVAVTLRPRSVIDLGCGNAFILEYLRQRIAGLPVCGVDGSPAALAIAEPEIRPFLRLGDLTRPLALDQGPAELVICTEVAEHLPAAAADMLVRNVCRHATRWVLFTAAPAGQHDPRHVNMRPPDYWQRLFAGEGWRPAPALAHLYQRNLTSEIRIARWLWTNVQFFKPE